MALAQATRSRRATLPARPSWTAVVLLVSALVAAPVVAVTTEALTSGSTAALPRGIDEMVVTTVVLLIGVGIGTLVLGGGLAWLVTAYRFPMRDALTWLLVLPLAMPSYILGFVFLSTFDVGGPVHGWLRATFGPDAWVPDVRSMTACVVVLTLTLYPYVYLLARSALLEQSSTTYSAARTLGAGPLRALFRVVLPLARPSLAAGLALVMMEVLTDFATVQYFGVKTVSVGVYLTWRGSYDFHAAALLSMLVLAFAVVVLIGERVLRGRSRYTQTRGRGEGLEPTRLRGVRAAGATLLCLLALSVAFVLPVIRLVVWAVDEARRDASALLDPRFGEYLANTLTVALVASVGCAGLALLLGHSVRVTGGPLPRLAVHATTFGYAVPGAVIGIGVLLAVAWVDRALEALGTGGTGLLVTGSVVGILYAYLVRFLAPAYQAVDASLTKVSPHLTQSAFSLGASPRRILTKVHLPLARSGVLVAVVLVVIDAVKELPVVLLLRPFGFTTISVWVYQLASENFWEKAALPALLIVAAATVPVSLLFHQVRLVDPHRGLDD